MKKLILAIAIAMLAACSLHAQGKAPRTAREYFMLLPEKYFDIECCGGVTNKKSKAQYLKQYLKAEDNANGYLSGYGDAAQEAFAMSLFKRPDGSYLIGFYTRGEGGVEDTPWTVFLNYSGGKWTDVSRKVVAGHNKEKYIYELPRKRKQVVVFSKSEMGDGYKGKRLYSLDWKNGKFVKGR